MEKTKQDYSQFPTYKKALEDAGLDHEVGLEDILDKPILVVDWEPDSRVVPQTKQRTQGYMMQGVFAENDENFKVFVGASVLVRELTAMKPPFTTVVKRSGQTYRFS